MSTGGIIGPSSTYTNLRAGGIWTITDQSLARSDNQWPRVPNIPSANLVLHYDAGYVPSYGGSGSTWTDLSGGTNTGDFVNSPPYSNTGFFTFTAANSQMVTTTNSFVNPQAFTVFVLFKTSTASGRKLIGFESNQTDTASSNYDRHLYVDTNGRVRFGIIPTSTIITTISSMTVTDNTWRLAVGTYGSEGTTMRLHINGATNNTNVASAAGQNYTGWWRIAGFKLNLWTNAGDGYFTGDIAAAGVYTRGISNTEVTEIYNAYKPYYSGL